MRVHEVGIEADTRTHTHTHTHTHEAKVASVPLKRRQKNLEQQTLEVRGQINIEPRAHRERLARARLQRIHNQQDKNEDKSNINNNNIIINNNNKNKTTTSTRATTTRRATTADHDERRPESQTQSGHD
jgi:hypothetical protein